MGVSKYKRCSTRDLNVLLPRIRIIDVPPTVPRSCNVKVKETFQELNNFNRKSNGLKPQEVNAL